jgi:hypothetical protein
MMISSAISLTESRHLAIVCSSFFTIMHKLTVIIGSPLLEKYSAIQYVKIIEMDWTKDKEMADF